MFSRAILLSMETLSRERMVVRRVRMGVLSLALVCAAELCEVSSASLRTCRGIVALGKLKSHVSIWAGLVHASMSERSCWGEVWAGECRVGL